MHKLLLATTNKGKLREYQDLLAGLPLEIVTLEEAGITVVVEETGATYEENAVAKASGYAKVTGMLTIADDSGLEVDALGGEPGVRSARYAGDEASDEDRIQLLLSNLDDVPDDRRQAGSAASSPSPFPERPWRRPRAPARDLSPVRFVEPRASAMTPYFTFLSWTVAWRSFPWTRRTASAIGVGR